MRSIVDPPLFEQVGANLQDHLEIYFQHECKLPLSLNDKLGPLSKLKIGVEWILTGGGLGSTNHFESCGFIRSARGVDYPDIQYHFLPAAMRYDGHAALAGHGFQLHVGPMRSASRGTVTAISDNVVEKPKIQFNYLSSESDMVEWRRCVKLTFFLGGLARTQLKHAAHML
eukprot:SAG31_NODE_171_length_21415_cov_7.512807_6_plen_171_part_00